MLKVITACGSGMGSSQIIQMKLEKTFTKLNVNAEILHTNVAEAREYLWIFFLLMLQKMDLNITEKLSDKQMNYGQ